MRVFLDSNRKLSEKTAAEKTLPYFLFRFFHPNKLVSDLQPLAANFIVSSFFLFSTFCMRCSWLIVIDIVRLLSARFFKFTINSWNFVRIFLSSFLLKILKETSLEITKPLTSALFWAYLFSLQISTIYILLENIFYTDSTLQKNYTLSFPWDISYWLAYITMKMLFNHERMLIAWYLKLTTVIKPELFTRKWLIKAWVRSKDQKCWPKKNPSAVPPYFILTWLVTKFLEAAIRIS